MTLGDLLEQLGLHPDELTNNEKLNYELQFHYDCLWYQIDKLDRVDDKNQRIILESNRKEIK